LSAPRPLRITWVLPFQRFTGGIRVVYEHSRQLLARGHDVTLVVPREDPTNDGSASGPMLRQRLTPVEAAPAQRLRRSLLARLFGRFRRA